MRFWIFIVSLLSTILLANSYLEADSGAGAPCDVDENILKSWISGELIIQDQGGSASLWKNDVLGSMLGVFSELKNGRVVNGDNPFTAELTLRPEGKMRSCIRLFLDIYNSQFTMKNDNGDLKDLNVAGGKITSLKDRFDDIKSIESKVKSAVESARGDITKRDGFKPNGANSFRHTSELGTTTINIVTEIKFELIPLIYASASNPLPCEPDASLLGNLTIRGSLSVKQVEIYQPKGGMAPDVTQTDLLGPMILEYKDLQMKGQCKASCCSRTTIPSITVEDENGKAIDTDTVKKMLGVDTSVLNSLTSVMFVGESRVVSGSSGDYEIKKISEDKCRLKKKEPEKKEEPENVVKAKIPTAVSTSTSGTGTGTSVNSSGGTAGPSGDQTTLTCGPATDSDIDQYELRQKIKYFSGYGMIRGVVTRAFATYDRATAILMISLVATSIADWSAFFLNAQRERSEAHQGEVLDGQILNSINFDEVKGRFTTTITPDVNGDTLVIKANTTAQAAIFFTFDETGNKYTVTSCK